MQLNDPAFEYAYRLQRHQKRCDGLFWEGYQEKMAAFSSSVQTQPLQKLSNMSFDLASFANQQAAQMPTNLQNGAPTPDAMAFPTQPGAPTTLANATPPRPSATQQPLHMKAPMAKKAADYHVMPHQAREILGGPMNQKAIQRNALKAAMEDTENEANKAMRDKYKTQLFASEAV